MSGCATSVSKDHILNTSMNPGVSVAILTTCSCVTTGCGATGRANVPAIEFTLVPAAGPGGSDTHEFIEGGSAGS